MRADVLIVGAGIAGLACARTLVRGGARPRLLERSPGTGGRCATRRVEGVPLDHGLGFVHGSDPDFLRVVGEVEDATPLPGWPERRRGAGPPCQPSSFDPRESRTVWVEGVRALPRHLSRGLEVCSGRRVEHLDDAPGEVKVRDAGGAEEAAPWVVLALPAGQMAPLLATLPAGRERDAVATLVETASEAPCLTVLATYSRDVPEPAWDMLYPEDSSALQLVSNEGSKRPGAPVRPLVLQARSGWSRRRWTDPPEDWARDLLAEAARQLGRWAAAPRTVQPHRWRYARAEGGTTLSRPILISLPRGGRVGLAGEMFTGGGGAQAAWKSGHALAQRILGEERA